MSVSTGPNTVKDGLVLSLDAASGRSFRGEPVENIYFLSANSSANNSIFSMPAGGTVTCSFTSTHGRGSWNGNTIFQVTVSPGTVASFTSFRRCVAGSFDQSHGTTKRLSAKIKMIKGSISDLAIHNGGGNANHNASLFTLINPINIPKDAVDKDGWYQIDANVSGNFPSSQCVGIAIRSGDVEFLVTEMMLYPSSYFIPFTDTVRGATVAAGGGLSDMSGNENHGQLINGPKFDTSENGSLLLDGINDYILIDNPTAFTGPYTILLWLKPDIALVPGGSGPNRPTGTNRKVPLVGPGPIWNPGIWMTSDYIRSHAKTQYVDSAINWTTTTWDMIGMTYDGTNVKNILGGKILADTHITSYSPSNPSTLHIGSETNAGNAFNWNGKIGSLKIYNRVLLPHEIQQNFNALRGRYGV